MFMWNTSKNTPAPKIDPAVEEIMDDLGDDENLVICDNIERALYLSLKYEFVTPLTSLVVVSPDEAPKEGDLSEAMGHNRKHTINLLSGSPASFHLSTELATYCCLLPFAFLLLRN